MFHVHCISVRSPRSNIKYNVLELCIVKLMTARWRCIIRSFFNEIKITFKKIMSLMKTSSNNIPFELFLDLLEDTGGSYGSFKIPSSRRAPADRLGKACIFPCVSIKQWIMKVPRFESTYFSKVSSKTLVKSINADRRLGDLDYLPYVIPVCKCMNWMCGWGN